MGDVRLADEVRAVDAETEGLAWEEEEEERPAEGEVCEEEPKSADDDASSESQLRIKQHERGGEGGTDTRGSNGRGLEA